jgi:hypothetical protein
MIKNYLPKRVHFIFLISMMICLFLLGFKYFLYLFLFYLITLFLFRKNSKKLYKEINSSKGLIFSPVFGKLIKIKTNVSHKVFGQNLIELRFTIPIGSEMGLYLPTECEITDLILKWGTVISRFGEIPSQEINSLDVPLLKIKNKNNEIIGMEFVECVYGFFPHFYILPGDKGKALANFGYFPLGGTVLLYLPGNYEILVKENSRVSPKDVLIATLKA